MGRAGHAVVICLGRASSLSGFGANPLENDRLEAYPTDLFTAAERKPPNCETVNSGSHSMDDGAKIAARGGWAPPFTTPPSNPPIYMTTAFDLEGLDQLDAVAAGRERGYIYTRDGNPNHDAFAGDVAKLEGAEAGCAFASGMGAMWATLVAHVQSGDTLSPPVCCMGGPRNCSTT